MRLGKQYLHLVEIIFSERLPQPGKYLWGISYEYWLDLPQPTEKRSVKK